MFKLYRNNDNYLLGDTTTNKIYLLNILDSASLHTVCFTKSEVIYTDTYINGHIIRESDDEDELIADFLADKLSIDNFKYIYEKVSDTKRILEKYKSQLLI